MPLEEDNNVLGVRQEDPEMIEAIHQARGTLGQFLENFISPQPNQTSFLLKVVFEENGEREHIWMADLELHTDPPTGVVANEPGLQGLRYMERVPFSPSDVTDWMYLEDGALVGGFTTRLLLKKRRPQ